MVARRPRRRRVHERGTSALIKELVSHAAYSVVFGGCRITVVAICRLVKYTVSSTYQWRFVQLD